jgi:hypothetical protein
MQYAEAWIAQRLLDLRQPELTPEEIQAAYFQPALGLGRDYVRENLPSYDRATQDEIRLRVRELICWIARRIGPEAGLAEIPDPDPDIRLPYYEVGVGPQVPDDDFWRLVYGRHGFLEQTVPDHDLLRFRGGWVVKHLIRELADEFEGEILKYRSGSTAGAAPVSEVSIPAATVVGGASPRRSRNRRPSLAEQQERADQVKAAAEPAMKRLGYASLWKLAEAAGVEYATVRDYFNGLRSPRRKTLQAIADILEIEAKTLPGWRAVWI